MKYRKTICQDEGFSKGMWFIAPIDRRKKYYLCHHCQKEHLTKEGLFVDKSKLDKYLEKHDRKLKELFDE